MLLLLLLYCSRGTFKIFTENFLRFVLNIAWLLPHCFYCLLAFSGAMIYTLNSNTYTVVPNPTVNAKNNKMPLFINFRFLRMYF